MEDDSKDNARPELGSGFRLPAHLKPAYDVTEPIPAPDNKRKAAEEDQPAPGRRSGRATQPSAKLTGTVSWDAVRYSGESIHYSATGTGISKAAAKIPRFRNGEIAASAPQAGPPA